MPDQFARDLAQKLADENVPIHDWDIRKAGSGVLVDLCYDLTSEQARMLHVIDEHAE